MVLLFHIFAGCSYYTWSDHGHGHIDLTHKKEITAQQLTNNNKPSSINIKG